MTDTDTCIHFSVREQIACIRLDNPAKHNALTVADINCFIAHLETIEETPAIRVLVVTGSGDKTFCAGASLEELSSGTLNSKHFERLTDRLASLTIPTLCALNGSAFGGGAEMGLCCDFRIGVHGMMLMVPAARFGLCYPPSGIQRYVQSLGLTAAKRLLVTSEEFDGDSLLGLGYLTHLVEPAALQSTTRKLAESICELAPLAVSAMKQICDQSASGSIDETVATALAERCHHSRDLQEGLRAKQEKRSPVFSGL
jgi:enoyl-CoA hydratase/carnithine racemase